MLKCYVVMLTFTRHQHLIFRMIDSHKNKLTTNFASWHEEKDDDVCLHVYVHTVIQIFSTFNMVIADETHVVPICSFLARLFLEQLILMKISLPQIVQNYHEEKDDVCRHVYIHTSSTSFQAW